MSERDREIAAAVQALRADFDAEIVVELLSTYLRDSLEYIGRAQSAIAGHDLAALASAAHGMKGSVANFGASRAVELADALQQSAKSGVPLPALQVQFESLQRELAEVRACLELQRAGLSDPGRMS